MQLMTPRGQLIALEGIDGSGKRTQLDLLAHELDARGLATLRISFPRYESSFGKLIARYLNGAFGSLETVDPHLSALCGGSPRSERRTRISFSGRHNCSRRSLYRLESRPSDRARASRAS